MSARIIFYFAHRLWFEKSGIKRKIKNSVNNYFFCELERDRHYSIPGEEYLGMARGT
jgi:hypothetical protein